jgi:hypothetical protein
MEPSILILSVTLVTFILGRPVRTLSGTPNILNEVFCCFSSGLLEKEVYNLKQVKNASYEIVFLFNLPFDVMGNGFGFA